MPRKWENGAIALSLALLYTLVASSPRPIWTDEFIQFAFAAFPSFPEALNKIHRSIAGVNHGQTGFYLLLNYLALRMGGAHYWALRGPSYLSYLIGLGAGLAFLRRRRATFATQLLFLYGLGLSELSLLHGAEARPYAPLQAAVLMFFDAWDRYLAGGRRGLAGVAVAAIFGILFHPFFPLYAGLIALGSVVFLPGAWARIQTGWGRLVLVGGGSLALFGALAAWSWSQTWGEKFGFDPYAWIGRAKPVPFFMAAIFFHPYGKVWLPLAALLAAVLVYRRRSGEFAELWRYELFVLAVLLISQAALFFLVVRSGYWLLQRQWTGGNGLAFLASALLAETGLRAWRKDWIVARALPAGVLALGLGFTLFSLSRNFAVPAAYLDAKGKERLIEQIETNPELNVGALVALAHQNLSEGGPVWPIFRRYYP